ncbi:MAG TPA: hypothetical protein VJ461_00690 [Candidatus Nanoarchaeia archaeon]|nr:hypothetical protein [Candidatus Nanoarchaeia archaeon]
MKISRHDKLLLFEQEVVALVLIIVLGFVFYYLKDEMMFYLVTLILSFIFYFWMIYEERIHETGKKHVYFEHTSSYIMIAQTALVLGLLSMIIKVDFLMVVFNVISVIMYSVSLSRIILYKVVFRK